MWLWVQVTMPPYRHLTSCTQPFNTLHLPCRCCADLCAAHLPHTITNCFSPRTQARPRPPPPIPPTFLACTAGAAQISAPKCTSHCAHPHASHPHLLGTPTPSSTQSSDISHLQPLLSFLHHDPYGSNTNKAAWDAAVRIPFQARRPEGRERLLELLRRCMIR